MKNIQNFLFHPFQLCKSIVLIALLWTLVGSNRLSAQLFKAGIVGGVSFAQIEGDDVSGYSKFGANAGGIVAVDINEKFQLSLEILYAQKGAASGISGRQQGLVAAFKIQHEYVEIPIVFHYKDPKGMNFGIGFAPSRHIRSIFIDDFGMENPTYFEGAGEMGDWDFGGIFDLAYRINNFSHVNLRLTASLIPYQERFSVNRNQITGQFNNVITLRYLFLVSALREKRL